MLEEPRKQLEDLKVYHIKTSKEKNNKNKNKNRWVQCQSVLDLFDKGGVICGTVKQFTVSDLHSLLDFVLFVILL